MISRKAVARAAIPFRLVNNRAKPGYDPHLQKHHLMPRQVFSSSGFHRMFEALGKERIGYDDFRANGLLLPANVERAMRLHLPLHRGPHRHYNDMVMERVGQIERDWSAVQGVWSATSGEDAMMRINLLRAALRRRLVSGAGKALVLNRHDPRNEQKDFSDLYAMAEELWGETG